MEIESSSMGMASNKKRNEQIADMQVCQVHFVRFTHCAGRANRAPLAKAL